MIHTTRMVEVRTKILKQNDVVAPADRHAARPEMADLDCVGRAGGAGGTVGVSEIEVAGAVGEELFADDTAGHYFRPTVRERYWRMCA